MVDDTAQGNIFAFPREADLDRHLNNNTDTTTIIAANEAARRDALSPEERKAEDERRAAALKKPIEFGSKDDYQMQQALHLLRGEPVETKSMTAAVSRDKMETGEQKESHLKEASKTPQKIVEPTPIKKP